MSVVYVSGCRKMQVYSFDKVGDCDLVDFVNWSEFENLFGVTDTTVYPAQNFNSEYCMCITACNCILVVVLCCFSLYCVLSSLFCTAICSTVALFSL